MAFASPLALFLLSVSQLHAASPYRGVPWRERGVPEPLEPFPGYVPVTTFSPFAFLVTTTKANDPQPIGSSFSRKFPHSLNRGKPWHTRDLSALDFPFRESNLNNNMTERENRALQVPPVVLYKALGKFPKALYETT